MVIDTAALSDEAQAPSWFTPKRLIVAFCVINVVNSVDRGAIASNGVNGSPRICTESGMCSDGSGIQGDLNLNNFRDGVISSAFMVGLLVASPIFASLAKSIDPFRLIGVGLSVWTLAAAGCGFSVDFWSLTICRMLIGVGEASFLSLAPPFIDENAPVDQRAACLGIFFVSTSVGNAVGYVYGGLVGASLGWRCAFFGEAIIMLPFAFLGFTMKPLHMKGMSTDRRFPTSLNEDLPEHSSKKHSSYLSFTSSQLSTFWLDIQALLHEKKYVINMLGFIAYTFVFGAYSYWAPKAGYSIYQMNNADFVFGGMTLSGGTLGTLGGSIILDRMNSTVSNAFKLLSATTFFGAIFCTSAFCFSNLYVFMVLYVIGEIFGLAATVPVNFVNLHTVKPSLRPLAMAMLTVSVRIFGAVPSTPLVGILQDKVDNWRTSFLILNSLLFLASGIWFIGIFLHNADGYSEDNKNLVTSTKHSDVIPLLLNKPDDAIYTSTSL
uniref:probable sphingolipid transporter spinster homolog 2 n=1 Tax=Erigeron canadensis TaxID=72917 RepID=UPI001CB902A5|nr:probable sphingolipid transporter spinster homolog 2 [Erigeron canadensis]